MHFEKLTDNKMDEGPLIEKRRYGTIHDYIVTFNKVPSIVNLPTFDKDVWVVIKISKSLDLKHFRPILKDYFTHRFYKDNNYYLFFSREAKMRLPVYNYNMKLHEHINLKIIIGDQKLKVKPKYGSSWVFLSGGVRYMEAPEDAARRELYEELGIKCDSKLTLIKTKIMNMNIPILSKPIKTMMYYYTLTLEKLPDIKLDKTELSQVKLGNMIVCA